MNDLEKLQDQSPHAAAIGFVLTGTDGPACLFKMPYAEHLVGDPDTGVIHGGAITAILDNACGWAVRNHPDWDSESSMATLDLRDRLHGTGDTTPRRFSAFRVFQTDP